jgi:excisionase family DNA binding protein
MDDNIPVMYRPQEIADRCQISTRTVMRAIRSGQLRASRLGARGAYRVRPEDLEAWIVATTVLPPLSSAYRLQTDPIRGGRLSVRGDHGHRAPRTSP